MKNIISLSGLLPD